jgi:putative aldouronate transport system substrate-binding protein
MILGSYYLSIVRNDEPGAGGLYRNFDEANMAYLNGQLGLHAPIALRVSRTTASGAVEEGVIGIKKNENGEYVKFLFNGKWMPVIADETFAELWDKAGGNYTNYARQYLGSTLSFVKSQAFEYQCTHEVGKEGAGKISYAIKYGTIKHPALAVTENPWYSIVPTTLPNTAAENDSIALLTNLSSKGKFSQSKGNNNLFLDIIAKGFVALDSEE